MTLTSPNIGSVRPQLLRALRGALDGIDEGAPHAPLLESREPRNGGAARRGNHVLELTRMRSGLQDESGRAQHRLRGQGHGRGAVEPHLDAAIGQRLDHDGDIGGAPAPEAPPPPPCAPLPHPPPSPPPPKILWRAAGAPAAALCAR